MFVDVKRLMLFTQVGINKMEIYSREKERTQRNMMGDCALACRVTPGLVLLSTAAANLHMLDRISAVIIIRCVFVVTGAT